LSGLAGELRCCDDEAAVMLISLSQHDAETSSWDIGNIWVALREHLFDLRKISRRLGLDTCCREDACPRFFRYGLLECFVVFTVRGKISCSFRTAVMLRSAF